MKRQIRRGIFETNSSSMHSLTVKKRGVSTTLPIDPTENRVITHFGEFGFGYDSFTDPKTKLSYLVTMLVETHSDCCSMEALTKTDDFQRINNAVANYCHCDGIRIDEKIEKMICDDDFVWNEHNGFVDHMSIVPIRELLDDYNCTIEEFIFDEGIELIVDNC